MKPTKLPGIGTEFGIPHDSAQETKGSDAIGGSRLTKDLAESLQAELAESYQVSSPAEIDAAAALALALAKWIEVEAVLKVKVAQERATATVRFDRMAADAFDRDKAAWLKDPESRTSIFARSYRGARHLSEIWARVLRELKTGEEIPFELACHAVLATGSRWQVDKADEKALTIMASFVQISSDTAQAAETWARESKVRDGLAFARRRAEKAVARTPEVEQCRRWLLQVATQEAEGWKKVADKLRPDFEAARAAARDCAVGLGTGDPVLEKELRNLNRLATTAHNRTVKLQGNLEALIKKRDTKVPHGRRDSVSRSQAKSNAGRSGPSLCVPSQSPAESKAAVSVSGSGSTASVRESGPENGCDAAANEHPAIPGGRRTAESQKVASFSEVESQESDAPHRHASLAEVAKVRLTPSERKLLKMIRKVPDSPRRRNDIVRLFGSEQRFREMCAALDSR